LPPDSHAFLFDCKWSGKSGYKVATLFRKFSHLVHQMLKLGTTGKSPAGGLITAWVWSVKLAFEFIFFQRLVAFHHIEADQTPDFYEGENSTFHQLCDGADVALEVGGNFPFRFPGFASPIIFSCLNYVHTLLCLAVICIYPRKPCHLS